MQYNESNQNINPARRAKMDEQTLKALSLIAAELHIQNYISIAVVRNIPPDFSYVSERVIEGLADHFKSYFEGGRFSPGSAFKITVE